MQSEAEAVRAAESCVLGSAERHANGPETLRGGTCRDCGYCLRDCFDAARGAALRDVLNAEYGICAGDRDEPRLTPLDEWYPWDECWIPRRD